MNLINFNTAVAGKKRAVVLKASDRSVVSDTGWTNNLITDTGLDALGTVTASWVTGAGYCFVGTGNTPPANADNSLVTQIAKTTLNVSGGASSGAVTASPRYLWNIEGWEFPEGTFSGENLAEVGFSYNNVDSNLCSRSLFLDNLGSPTTVTVQSDEILQVFYEFRLYVPETDATGTITETNSSDSYNFTLRAANSDSHGQWNPTRTPAYDSFQDLSSYTGLIGTIDDQPSTPSGGSTSNPTVTTYVPGSFSLTKTFNASISELNAAGGIKSVLFEFGWALFQCEYDPVIPKTSSLKLDLPFTMTWSRATI